MGSLSGIKISGTSPLVYSYLLFSQVIAFCLLRLLLSHYAKNFNGDAKLASLVVTGDVNSCVAERGVAEIEKYSRRLNCITVK